MKLGSLFSGILGFDLGFEREGFETVWRSEIDRFCNKVSDYRRPGIVNLGNVEEIDARQIEPVDVISFGSPCQDLSVAGRRAGLAGARSGLFFEAARIINECRPAFAVWENVPGSFSSDAGRDFWTVLYCFRELGANDVAWRVFDSQYAGVPQQRRRVYLVADFRGRRAAEVLFEPEGCGGHPAPGGEAGPRAAYGTPSGLSRTLGRVGGGDDYGANKGTLVASAITPGHEGKHSYPGDHNRFNLVAATLGAGQNRTGGDRFPGMDADTAGRNLVTTGPRIAKTLQAPDGAHNVDDHTDLLVAHALTSEGFDASEDGTGRGTPLAFQTRVARNGRGAPKPLASALTALGGKAGGRRDTAQFVAIAENQRAELRTSSQVGTAIRRFTPVECERLQGFPDGWTCLCGAEGDIFACRCPDGPRYRALGNAVTVTVTQRIARGFREVLL